MLRYGLSTAPPVRPKRLRFAILSAEEIARMSVVEVTETMLYYTGLPAANGLLDPLMGSIDRRHYCATCMNDARMCQGHAGHIALAYPVYHLGFMDAVLRVLRCVCYGCSRLLLPDEEVAALRARRPSPTRRATRRAARASRPRTPRCAASARARTA